MAGIPSIDDPSHLSRGYGDSSYMSTGVDDFAASGGQHERLGRFEEDFDARTRGSSVLDGGDIPRRSASRASSTVRDSTLNQSSTPSRSGTLKKRLTLKLGLGQLLTAGDVSADGRTIVLRSYDRAFVWTRKRGETLARALRRAPCTADAKLLDEGQGEALALTRDGRAFYTVPEGSQPLLRRYEPVK